MKLFIILTVAALSSGAKLDKTYLPPSSAQTAGGDFLDTPNYADAFPPNNQGVNTYNYEADLRPERPQAAFERNAAILRQENVNNGDSYSFAFETENGIVAEESGVATNGVEAQGGFSYIGDDGKAYSIRYTADQNGFQPQGDHLPTPPPIPEEILKALEQNARDEAAGIFDDGSYNDAKYESNDYKGNYGNYETRYTVDPSNAQTDDDSIITDSAAYRNPNYFQSTRTAPSETKAYLPPSYDNRY